MTEFTVITTPDPRGGNFSFLRKMKALIVGTLFNLDFSNGSKLFADSSGQEYGTLFENDSLRVQFTIPQGVKNIQLRCISTAHGGWGGGDEFNPKPNAPSPTPNGVLFQ